MHGPPIHPRRPTFRWQAALILLPVVVLAIMGWLSLRQDKILTDHDAKERAQAVAEELRSKIWDELTVNSTADTNHPSFQVDENGQLIFPPPYVTVPTPKPFDLSELNSDQARLWRQLQDAENFTTNLAARVQAGKDFLTTQPPENVGATASYEMGLRLVRLGKYAEAAEAFERVVNEYPHAVGESGLPLQPLAQLKLFEIEPRAKRFPLYSVRSTAGRPVNSMFVPPFMEATNKHFISLDSLCSNIVYHPTSLTPHLLNAIYDQIIPEGEPIRGAEVDPYQIQMGTDLPETRAAIQKWQRIWSEHELSRRLFSLAKSHLPGVLHESLTLLETPAPVGQSGVVVGPFGSGSFTAAAGRLAAPRTFWINFPDGGKNWLIAPRDGAGSKHETLAPRRRRDRGAGKAVRRIVEMKIERPA